MSIRRFNGWEPVTHTTSTTTYEYDDDGRLLSATTETVSQPEPEFDDFDREHFETELDLQADTCSCGGLLSETTGDPRSYDVNHTTCWRCWALGKARREFDAKAEKDRDLVPSAEHWSAVAAGNT